MNAALKCIIRKIVKQVSSKIVLKLYWHEIPITISKFWRNTKKCK